MDVDTRLAELEAEVARLRAELDRRGNASAPPGEHPAVARVLSDRAVLANLPDFIMVLDREHRILYINRVATERRIEDMLGTSLLDYLVEEERASRRAALERAWTTGQIQTIESRTVNGYVFDNRIVPIFEGERVAYILTTSVDVTERTRAEDALRESAALLRHTIEATGFGTWVRTPEGVVWDPALCRILGVECKSIPRNVDAFEASIHPDDRERALRQVESVRQTGVGRDIECRICRPDGTIRHVIVKISVELDPNGAVYRSFGGVLDVTERRALEEQLRQAQKMDAIGHLTAGIAHNFNNILGIILPNAELSRRQAGPQIAARLDDIVLAAERGAEMIRHLMLFARPDALARKEPVSGGDLARRAVAICKTTFDRAITIGLSVAPDAPVVLANAGQFEQVLLNICLNARDALEEARTPNARIDVEVARSSGGNLRIRVSDNGPGMDEATRSRVFDPFFTTKEVDRGTGLGLATAYAIVSDHHGQIVCESRAGEGTAFEIELPSSERVPNELAPAPTIPPIERTETLLLVDDEPLVRSATRDLLELGGFRVLEADDGQTALATFEREKSRIAAVILDRSMPGMSGEAVLEKLDRTVPVVVLSGHLGSSEGWENAAAVLTKPVSAAALLETVRGVIDRARLPVAS